MIVHQLQQVNLHHSVPSGFSSYSLQFGLQRFCEIIKWTNIFIFPLCPDLIQRILIFNISEKKHSVRGDRVITHKLVLDMLCISWSTHDFVCTQLLDLLVSSTLVDIVVQFDIAKNCRYCSWPPGTRMTQHKS